MQVLLVSVTLTRYGCVIHVSMLLFQAEFNATDLVRSCVQSAVSMLRDQEDSGALSTRRVEILLTLMEDSEHLKG